MTVCSDSAFSAGEVDGLSVRGCFIMITEDDQTQPGGKGHVLDWVSRKQSHVTRATFAAELFGLLDSLNLAFRIMACITEIQTGTALASQLARRQDEGRWSMPVEGVIDAKSVFDSIASQGQVRASEGHLIVHLRAVQQWIARGQLRALWWADTRDMVADGITKGKVDRLKILELVEKGRWILEHAAQRHALDIREKGEES